MKEQSYEWERVWEGAVPLLWYREICFNVCIKTAFGGGGGHYYRGRFCSGIDQFPPSASPLFKTLQSKGDGGMGPCVPLSYTSVGGVARICQRGRGKNGNFCTLNAIIRGRLCI